MSTIDVSDLLHDPNFVDSLQILTRYPRVNGQGENIINEVCASTIGCVQPASGKTISRLPEALRVANISDFWIQGDIVATEPGKYSSIIVYKGKRYQVQTVRDWSNFGAGYTEGTCVAEVLA